MMAYFLLTTYYVNNSTDTKDEQHFSDCEISVTTINYLFAFILFLEASLYDIILKKIKRVYLENPNADFWER